MTDADRAKRIDELKIELKYLKAGLEYPPKEAPRVK